MSLRNPQAARSSRVSSLCVLAFLAVLFGMSRSAAAQDAQMPAPFTADNVGAALTVDAIIGTGSVVSIIGNSVDLARGKPQRGWMYSGFALGFMNAAMGPIIIVFGRGQIEALGYGLGAAHLVLGLTNLGLAIGNGVRWHRQNNLDAPPVAQRPQKLALTSFAPLVAPERQGGAVIGLTAGGSF